MHYDPRTIAFGAEILYPPQQLRADLVQSVHNTLYRHPSLGYQNFQVQNDGIHLSNLPQAPGQVSSTSFAWDRLVIREELRGTTVEDFATRVVNVVQIACQTLGITASLAQQFVVRSLVQPRHHRDAREFLGTRVVAPGHDAWSALGRAPQSIGLRFAFAPTEPGREGYQIRIENWPADARSLWLENTGSFAGVVPVAEAPRLADHLYATYRFLTGPVGDFLAALDTP